MRAEVINVHHHDIVHAALQEGRLVRIHRPSIWGNPYTHLPVATTRARYQVASVDEALRRYEEHVRRSPALMALLHTLEGKVLGCVCKPKPCHGDVLIKLLEELQP